MAPFWISSLESERPVGSYHSNVSAQPPRIQAERGKRHTVIGGHGQGGIARWRRRSMPLALRPYSAVEHSRGRVDGSGRQDPSKSISSTVVLPTDQPLAPSAVKAVLPEEQIFNSAAVAQGQQAHGYEKRAFLPYLTTTMAMQRAPGEISSGKFGNKEHEEHNNHTVLPSWTPTGHHGSSNSTECVEKLLVPGKLAQREDFVIGTHKQASMTVAAPPPNISEITGYFSARKNCEMMEPKGLQHSVDFSFAKESRMIEFRSLDSSVRQNMRGPYICSECKKSFPSGQALGGHVKSHNSRKRTPAQRDDGRPTGWVASTSLTLVSPNSIAMNGSSNPRTMSVPNQKREVLAAAHINNIRRGSFRLFGNNIVEAPKEEPME